MNPNFIQIRLCDNDFGQELETAARIIDAHLGQGELYVSEGRIEGIVVRLVVALADLRAATRGFASENQSNIEYLMSKTNVVFSDKAPEDDHDGGSVAIDRRLGYVWRF